MKRPLPKGKNRKVIGAMKDELSGKIMKKFVGLRAKTYSYLADNNDKDKKRECTKSVSWKENLHLKIINIVKNQLNLKITSNHLEKSNLNVDHLRENHKEVIEKS